MKAWKLAKEGSSFRNLNRAGTKALFDVIAIRNRAATWRVRQAGNALNESITPAKEQYG